MSKHQNCGKHKRITRKKYLEAAGKLGYSGFLRELTAFDMFIWRNLHHCFPKEYIQYRFDRLKPSRRKEYLLKFDQYITYARINLQSDLKTKIEQYKRLGDLIGRDWIQVNTGNIDAVRSFAKTHSKVLFKPIDSSLGKGIFSYEPATDSEETLFRLLVMCTMKHYLCEEFIIQHPLMASFHPQSVNSVRILTFNDGKEIKILAATLKMGINNSEVDNIAHGGLGANIDVDTGIVNTAGFLQGGEPQYTHPDTGVKIIGTEIPLFNKVKEIVIKGASLVPEWSVIGWDVAISSESVSIIEMNNRPSVDIVQIFDGLPKGKEIKKFVRENGEHVRKLSREARSKNKRYY